VKVGKSILLCVALYQSIVIALGIPDNVDYLDECCWCWPFNPNNFL